MYPARLMTRGYDPPTSTSIRVCVGEGIFVGGGARTKSEDDAKWGGGAKGPGQGACTSGSLNFDGGVVCEMG
jgi:hypothetical protein